MDPFGGTRQCERAVQSRLYVRHRRGRYPRQRDSPHVVEHCRGGGRQRRYQKRRHHREKDDPRRN